MTAPTPPDAAQTVVAAYQALLTAETDQAVAYETYMRASLEDSRPTRLAYDRAILGRHKAQDALYTACAALLTPAQVAYTAYVAALVAEDAARQMYGASSYIFDEDDAAAKVAVQVATENKHSAAAAWQAAL